jgi:hypothetical protein
VSEASDKPVLYRVSYSKRVEDELRRLIFRARDRGMLAEVLAAIKEIDERLRLYPQFGQPLRDLSIHPLQVWIAAVPSLVVKYVLDEEGRQVMVGEPLKPLSKSGL